MISLIISLVVFISYLAYVLIKYGIQRSISDSYYRLTKIDGWMFTIATWGYSFPLIFAANGDGILFLAGVLICAVGAAPDATGADKGFHSAFAEGGIAVALAWMIFHVWFVAVPTILLIALIYYKKYRNHTWWIEVVAYLSIVLSIYLNLKK